ncbi:MAG: hypothetical protein COT85_07355 [Chlamydiae bacterium CG10_big_fil_rev_8_21_14_0_10_42_34]|nr:MAG: hypothetical protein COT85_07355 [Chlamydiae bacterium CG10_big_fil_rev_8_21_14_0_10_42_34]
MVWGCGGYPRLCGIYLCGLIFFSLISPHLSRLSRLSLFFFRAFRALSWFYLVPLRFLFFRCLNLFCSSCYTYN